MMRHGIAKFVGSWISASGHRLKIRKVRKTQALVDFLEPSGSSVLRPYMGGAPSTRMPAHYDDYYGLFEVDLWERGKGFIMELIHAYDYELDEHRREALVPGISRFERDRFLEEFYPLFGPLAHFVRQQTQNKSAAARGALRFAIGSISARRG
jgi:hypothetical protein